MLRPPSMIAVFVAAGRHLPLRAVQLAVAAACPPSATVDGPAAIAKPIATLLRRHGVEPGPSRCGSRVVHAFVSDGAGRKRLPASDRGSLRAIKRSRGRERGRPRPA